MKKRRSSLHDTFYLLGTVFLLVCFAYLVEVVQSSTSEWTDFSDWSSCSAQSCNSGVRFRTRTWCNSLLNNATNSAEPLDFNRKRPSCPGAAVEYEVCTNQTCNVVKQEHRIEQCTSNNGRRVMGHVVHNWTPNVKMAQSCQLSCYSQRHRLTYSFGKVWDGAKCHQSAPKVCLNGRCLPVGCDRKLGSTATLDLCGVCGGKSDTCRLIKQIYSPSAKELKKKAFSAVITIPAEATSIQVHSDGNNHLVLLDSQRNVILNGSVNGDGVYKAARADTTVRYFRGQGAGRGEWFRADGPIADHLHIMVLSGKHMRNPRVEYEFRVPLNSAYPLTTNSLMTSRPDNPANTTYSSMISSPESLTKLEKKRKRKRNKSGRKCPPCRKETMRNVKQHFCASDFVLSVLVQHVERHKDEIRYELQVSESFRNLVPIHPREFLWAAPIRACSCPKFALVRGRQYIVIGNTDKNVTKREVRLVVDEDSYVRRYSRKRALKMQDLSKLCAGGGRGQRSKDTT